MITALRGNSLYVLVDSDSWTSADYNASLLGGNLATINSESEDLYIWNTSASQTGVSLDGNQWGYWIGLRRLEGTDYTSWDNWF
jgi:hypothetical protein